MSLVKTGVDVVWGVPAARQMGTGYTSISSKYKPTRKSKTLSDANGETKTHIGYDVGYEMDLELYPSGGTPATLPALGAIVTVSSVDWMVVDAEESSTADGEQKFNLKLQNWSTNIDLTP